MIQIQGHTTKPASALQVCSDVVVLLAGSSKQTEATVQQLLAPPEAPTSIQGEKAAAAALPSNTLGVETLAASVADPYLLLHLSNGSAVLLFANLETGDLSSLLGVPAQITLTGCSIESRMLISLCHDCENACSQVLHELLNQTRHHLDRTMLSKSDACRGIGHLRVPACRAEREICFIPGKLEVLPAARAVLHEIPASDPSAHITSCALYMDSSGWLVAATETQARVFCLTTNASGLLQVLYCLLRMQPSFSLLVQYIQDSGKRDLHNMIHSA